MPENALDRLAKIDTPMDENKYTLEEQLEDSMMSSNEFLEGMSELAKENLSSRFEEVTLGDDPQEQLDSQILDDNFSMPSPDTLDLNSMNSNAENTIISTEELLGEPEQPVTDENTSFLDTIGLNSDKNVDSFADLASSVPQVDQIVGENNNLESFSSKIESNSTQNDASVDQNIDSTEENDENIDDVAKLKAQLDKFRKKVTSLSSTIYQLRQSKQALHEKNKDLSNQLEDALKKIEKLQKSQSTGSNEPVVEEKPFNNNRGADKPSSSTNIIFDCLAKDILDALEKDDYKINNFNGEAMSLLFTYMKEKF